MLSESHFVLNIIAIFYTCVLICFLDALFWVVSFTVMTSAFQHIVSNVNGYLYLFIVYIIVLPFSFLFFLQIPQTRR